MSDEVKPANWWAGRGVDDYVDRLLSEDIDSPDLVLSLSDDDFVQLGISIGGKRRLLGAARAAVGEATAGGEPIVERRHLTILFCDLVGSTSMSERLDPEDVAVVLGEYADACRAAVHGVNGHIAKFLGDGVLAYFGYPVAYEDSPQRAVQAGLDIVGRMDALNAQRVGEPALEVRVGIATGLVVVGDILADVNRADEVAGVTPNLAARVQGEAAPGTVTVSASTARLIAADFACTNIGVFELKGIEHPVELYRVDGAHQARSRFEASHSVSALPGLVGRDDAVAKLDEALQRARSAASPVLVSIEGEAGIGKSRLAYDFLDERATTVRVVQCSPLHQGTPLYPLVRHLRRRIETSGREPSALFDGVLDEAQWSEVAMLLGFRPEPVGLATPPAIRRTTLIEAFARIAAADADDGDEIAVILVEDLHWADPSTLAWIARLTSLDVGVLILVTHRREFEPGWTFDGDRYVHVPLGPLSSVDVAAMVSEFDAEVSAAELEELVARSAGVPLFVEELARAAVHGRGTTGTASIPESLHDSLMAQLDQLGSAKGLAQAASVLGREFEPLVLQRTAGVSLSDLTASLDALVEARIVTKGHDQYAFRHALLRDVAYESMVRSDRRRLHRSAAAALVEQRNFDVPHEVLAHHHLYGAQHEPAVVELTAAGEAAARRGASAEAIVHLDSALQLLDRLEPGPGRDALELRIQLQRGGMLKVTQGFGAPATGVAFDRAALLAGALGDDVALGPALLGQYAYWLQHDYARAGDAGRHLYELGVRQELATDRMMGDRTIGIVDYHMGRIGDGVSRLRRALAAYDRDRHADLRHLHGTDHATTSACFLGMALALHGDVGEGVELTRWSVQLADELAHGPSTAQALTYLGFVGTILGDPDIIDEAVPRLLAIAERIQFPLMAASGRFWQAVADYHQGGGSSAIEAMMASDNDWVATGNHGYQTVRARVIADALLDWSAVTGEAAGTQGVAPAADVVTAVIEQLDRADRCSASMNERLCEPEGIRLRAVVAERRGAEVEEVAAGFDRAMIEARESRTYLYELRAATTAVSFADRNGRRELSDRYRSMLEDVLGRVDTSATYSDLRAALEVASR